jgi:hypothetical protein
MATTEQVQPMTYKPDKPEHHFHAEASVLSGHLRQPIKREIEAQAPLLLKGDRRGGHFFQRAEHYSLEGLITFKSGYTHVSGNRSLKNHGWVTLSTSVLVGLNVLDVITADRMVAQVSTEHPPDEPHVPHVTFLGTHFENLRVGGYPVEVELDLGICGQKPADDAPYTRDSGFLKRVEQQCETISRGKELPSALRHEYAEELKRIAEIREHSNGSGNGHQPPKLRCSLVKSISPIPVAQVVGGVLEIPGFGNVRLAEVEITEVPQDPGTPPGIYFELNMLKMNMGCIGDGYAAAATVAANGHHVP